MPDVPVFLNQQRLRNEQKHQAAITEFNFSNSQEIA